MIACCYASRTLKNKASDKLYQEILFFLPPGFSENKTHSTWSLLLMRRLWIRFVIPEALTPPCSDDLHVCVCENAAGFCRRSAPQGQAVIIAVGTAGTWPWANTLLNAIAKFSWYRVDFTSPSLGEGGWSQEVYALLPSEFRTSQCIFCVRLDSTVDKRAPSAAHISNYINNNYLCSCKPIISLVWDLFSSILPCLNEGGYKTQ